MHAPVDIYQMLQSLADRVTALEQGGTDGSDPYVWLGLTVKEAEITTVLMAREDYISRQDLKLAVWGKRPPGSEPVDMHLANIRKKLGVALIASHGRGWMLTDLEKAAINRRLAVGRL